MIDKIGIIGCGRMGSKLAQMFASKYPVVVFDQDQQQLTKIKELENVTTTTRLNDLVNVNFIVECVFENLIIKDQILTELDQIVKPETILTTNTSSLSIDTLSTNLQHKDRFIGLHFMNPPEKIELAEIIRCQATSDSTFNTCVNLCNKIGKIPVESQDSPGFILNRILIPMLNEALYLLQEGVATKENIDKAMVLGAKHPIGPIALIDMIGLDIIKSVMLSFQKVWGAKYVYAKILDEYIEKGFLGKKVGRGFYKY